MLLQKLLSLSLCEISCNFKVIATNDLNILFLNWFLKYFIIAVTNSLKRLC